MLMPEPRSRRKMGWVVMVSSVRWEEIKSNEREWYQYRDV